MESVSSRPVTADNLLSIRSVQKSPRREQPGADGLGVNPHWGEFLEKVNELAPTERELTLVERVKKDGVVMAGLCEEL